MDSREKEKSLKLAEYYFQNNNYSFSQQILNEVIKTDLNNSKANELLAYIYGNLGKFEISFELLNVACNQNDCSPEALYYFGSMQLKRNLFSEAVETFKKSILKGGEFFEALHDLATAQGRLGDLISSLDNYQKCMKFGKASYELFYNIARTFDELKRYDEAIAHYDKALQLKPDFAEAWSNKGSVFSELKRYDEAIAHYDKALNLEPDCAEAWFNKGNIYSDLKRYDEAIAHYDKALQLKPDCAEAWSKKGNIYSDLKRYDEAIAHYDKALNLEPDCAEAWSNKGKIFSELNRHNEAIAHYDKALSLKPDLDWVYGNLLYAKMKICNWSGLAEDSKKIIKKVFAKEKVSLPFPLLTMNNDAVLLKLAAQTFAEDRYSAVSSLGPIQKPIKKEKIIIAYFSPDFRNHPVSLLTSELFEIHNRHKFEVLAFSLKGVAVEDKTNLRLRRAFDKFLDVENMPDKEIAQLAREHEIDIAIDLCGHTQYSRTEIFSYRVAPIQVNWLGYPGTIGAKFIDYILADRTIIPESHHESYVEKVVYLPDTFMVDDSKRVASSRLFTRQECGLPQNAFVFCCFNNDYKFNSQVLDGWARILHKVQDSVLWISENNEHFKINITTEFEGRGLNRSRLIFAKRIELMEDHLARYALVDLFLDTHPYNAHTTTLDSLKAGVPVLTRVGQSFASRVAASLLKAIGLPELIMNTQEEYEALAIELAISPEKLANIKVKLAYNRLNTPLFDTPLFAKNIENAYLKMYERYQSNLEPDHISIN